MKKIFCAFLIFLALTAPAFAVFSSKGSIPGAEPIEYRGLKITDKGVDIVVVNRSDSAYIFSAALSFVTRRLELADLYIEKLELAPNEHRQLRELPIKGDIAAAKKAESLKWTIYTIEEKAPE